jgi:hypothetical protein
MWNQLDAILTQVATRLEAAVVSLLPRILAMLLVILVFLVLGWLIRLLTRRFLLGIRFDNRVKEWGLALSWDWPPGKGPSHLAARLAQAGTVLVGVFLGLSVFETTATNALSVRVIAYVPTVMAACIIFFVGLVASGFLERQVLITAVNMQIQSGRLLSVGVKWLVNVLAAAMALDHLGVGGMIVTVSFSILFGGIVLALALAVGLGSRTAVSRSLERLQENAKGQETDPLDHL